MSSYLGFKKNGVVLCWFSRSSKIYQAFDYVSFDKWEKVTNLQLMNGISVLNEEKQKIIRTINTYKKVLEKVTSCDDILDTINSINELEDEVKEIDTAIIQINLLAEIAQESGENVENDFEWMVG